MYPTHTSVKPALWCVVRHWSFHHNSQTVSDHSTSWVDTGNTRLAPSDDLHTKQQSKTQMSTGGGPKRTQNQISTTDYPDIQIVDNHKCAGPHNRRIVAACLLWLWSSSMIIIMMGGLLYILLVITVLWERVTDLTVWTGWQEMGIWFVRAVRFETWLGTFKENAWMKTNGWPSSFSCDNLITLYRHQPQLYTSWSNHLDVIPCRSITLIHLDYVWCKCIVNCALCTGGCNYSGQHVNKLSNSVTDVQICVQQRYGNTIAYRKMPQIRDTVTCKQMGEKNLSINYHNCCIHTSGTFAEGYPSRHLTKTQYQ